MNPVYLVREPNCGRISVGDFRVFDSLENAVRNSSPYNVIVEFIPSPYGAEGIRIKKKRIDKIRKELGV